MNTEIISDIRFIFKKSIKQFYDKFLYLLLLNIFLIGIIFLIVTFGTANFYNTNYLLTVILYFLLMFFIITGEIVIKQYISSRYIRIKEVFTFIINNSKKLFLIFLFQLLAYSLFIVDIFYFFDQGLATDNLIFRYLFFLLVFISIYLLIILTMICFHLWGLLIYQRQKSALILIKRAAILSFDNLIFSFIMVALTIILTAIAFFTGFGLIILIPTLPYIIIFNSIELILDKY